MLGPTLLGLLTGWTLMVTLETRLLGIKELGDDTREVTDDRELSLLLDGELTRELDNTGDGADDKEDGGLAMLLTKPDDG